MTDFTFKAETRDQKAKDIRQNNLIPAILYGKNFDNLKLALEKIAFNRLYKEAGSSNLIDLNLDEGKEKVKVLIHDIQKHPVTDEIEHVDFLKIDMKKTIKTEIPIEYTGESPLVIEQEGSFISNKTEIEVECLPNDLIDHIGVDISVLTDFEQNLKVSDVKIPEGIKILDEPDKVIALVQPPRSEEELEALKEEVVEDVETVEVEEKGKEDDAGESDEKEKDEKKSVEEAPEIKEKKEK